MIPQVEIELELHIEENQNLIKRKYVHQLFQKCG